jgi:hypothetical protein
MTTRVQKGITAGVALVGAGVMAATPAVQQAPEVLRSATAKVELAAVVEGSTAELLTESGERLLGSLATAPTGLLAAAQAYAGGNKAVTYQVLKQFIDGPLYVADPIIYALDDLAPAPLGGDEDNETTQPGDSLITQFRSAVLYQSREEVGEALRDALGVAETPASNLFDDGVVYKASRIGFGLGESAVRGATSAVTAPLGLIAVAQGLQESFSTGDNTNLYLALQAYIDAPNYVTDPIVFAADDVSPAPVGGDPEKDPRLMNGSEITRLRGNVLLAPRDAVRNLVAGNLGVDPIDGHDVTPLVSTNKVAGDSNLGRFTPGSSKSVIGANASSGKPVNTALKAVNNEVQAAADRFQRRVEKLKSAVEKKKTVDTTASTN